MLIDRDELTKQYDKRPEMFVGPLPTAHLWPITESLRIVRRSGAFRSPGHADLCLAPTGFLLRCQSGLLKRPVNRAVVQALTEGRGREDLLAGLSEANDKLIAGPVQRLRGWRRCFASAYGPLLHYLIPCPTDFLDWCAVALSTSRGVFYQIYREGTAIGPTGLLAKRGFEGVVCAALLNPRFFPHLPYEPELARQRLAACGEDDVPVWWQPSLISDMWQDIDSASSVLTRAFETDLGGEWRLPLRSKETGS